MYAVFGLKKVLVFITALVVLVIIGLMVKEAPTDLVEFGKTAWKVSSGVVTAFIVFGSIPFVYRRAWKCYELIFKDAYPGRRQKLSATPDLSGTVLPLCLIPNSALKSAPPFKSVVPKASACAGLPA
jgi:hypothetical protein